MSKKTYIGISRDHSGSMQGIAPAAARDYNQNIEIIKEASDSAGQDTVVSVVECRSSVTRSVVNSSINALKPIPERGYNVGGMTALWDSIGELIEIMESTPDANDPDVSFLVMIITDGEENTSKKWTISKLKNKIAQLQKTDRWSFTFRVPRGHARTLLQFGIPEGNILEWDQTSRGMEVSTQATRQAFTQFYSDRAAGVKSTTRFYTNIAEVSREEIQAQLVDISGKVKIWNVVNDQAIRPFVEANLFGKPMEKGAAFYELTKVEDEVQDYKQIAIRDKKTWAVYSGPAARQMLNLPTYGTVRVAPGDHGDYEIYIQSTSVNRKLKAGTKLLYWSGAGVLK